MTVRQLCTHSSETCRQDSNLAAITASLWERDCGALPVLNAEHKVVGIITDRDICMALGTRDINPSRLMAKDVMSHPIFSVHPEDPPAEALRIMHQHRVRRLPVVDDFGHLVGMISINDLILAAKEDVPGSPAALSYGGVMRTLKAISGHATHRHLEHHESRLVSV